MEKRKYRAYKSLDKKIEKLSEPAAIYQTISFNPYEQAVLSSRGLPAMIMEVLSQRFDLTNKEMADFFDMSEKTYRNRIKEQAVLRPHESDLALSLLRLWSEGMETFEDKNNFLKWLNSSWEALEFKSPVTFMGSVSGVVFLIDELRSIRHGVFA